MAAHSSNGTADPNPAETPASSGFTSYSPFGRLQSETFNSTVSNLK